MDPQGPFGQILGRWNFWITVISHVWGLLYAVSEEDREMSVHRSGTSRVPAEEQNAKLYSNFTAWYQ